MWLGQMRKDNLGGDSSKDDTGGGNEKNEMLARQNVRVWWLQPHVAQASEYNHRERLFENDG